MSSTVDWVECNTEQWIDFLLDLQEKEESRHYVTQPNPHTMEFRTYSGIPLVRLDYSHTPRKAYYNQEVANHAQGQDTPGTGE